ncbi:Aste57867_3937 [Aphanomyces stellatus]|uniref:Ubiquitin carboxyl-terminal hydrolase n=1 Tax=Aphanomyces stellatus TaxID=120398 RepID=A0A485KF13_9STRA|nr:hypothetical protein As57867_003926 [Aphanomyces stellatus]VFT81074.1 Aste57867_3937 [Aphanomyces stellatus]
MADDQHPSVPGLRNLGNTCYFNAVLQALAASQHFQTYVSTLLLTGETAARPFTEALHDCLVDLSPKPRSQLTSSVVVPRALNSLLSEDTLLFRGMHQQDAEEGFQLIMEKLDKEVDRSQPDTCSLLWLAKARAATSPPRADPSIERNPFYGLTGNKLTCSACEMIKPVWTDYFLDLKLSLCQSMDSQRAFRHMRESLHHYTSKEYIDGVECTHCTLAHLLQVIDHELHSMATTPSSSRSVSLPDAARDDEASLASDDVDDHLDREADLAHHRAERIFMYQQLRDMLMKRKNPSSGVCDVDFDDPACWTQDELRVWAWHNIDHATRKIELHHATSVRHVVLARPPLVLAFHINRNVYLNESIVKLDVYMAFDATLVLRAPFLQHCESLAYVLVAVVVHHGNERGGHYTCYRRVGATQWVHVSDERVIEVPLAEVLRAKAYMLFYERPPDDQV